MKSRMGKREELSGNHRQIFFHLGANVDSRGKPVSAALSRRQIREDTKLH